MKVLCLRHVVVVCSILMMTYSATAQFGKMRKSIGKAAGVAEKIVEEATKPPENSAQNQPQSPDGAEAPENSAQNQPQSPDGAEAPDNSVQNQPQSTAMMIVPGVYRFLARPRCAIMASTHSPACPTTADVEILQSYPEFRSSTDSTIRLYLRLLHASNPFLVRIFHEADPIDRNMMRLREPKTSAYSNYSLDRDGPIWGSENLLTKCLSGVCLGDNVSTLLGKNIEWSEVERRESSPPFFVKHVTQRLRGLSETDQRLLAGFMRPDGLEKLDPHRHRGQGFVYEAKPNTMYVFINQNTLGALSRSTICGGVAAFGVFLSENGHPTVVEMSLLSGELRVRRISRSWHLHTTAGTLAQQQESLAELELTFLKQTQDIFYQGLWKQLVTSEIWAGGADAAATLNFSGESANQSYVTFDLRDPRWEVAGPHTVPYGHGWEKLMKLTDSILSSAPGCAVAERPVAF